MIATLIRRSGVGEFTPGTKASLSGGGGGEAGSVSSSFVPGCKFERLCCHVDEEVKH